MNEEKKVPEGTVFTVTVPLDRNQTKTATFYLKEMEEAVFLAAKSLQDQNKPGDAVRLIVKELSLPGSDSVELLRNNFIALNSASRPVMELFMPLDADLKKN